jgi:hypothetical protein
MFLIPFKDPDDAVATQEMGQTMICLSAFLPCYELEKPGTLCAENTWTLVTPKMSQTIC